MPQRDRSVPREQRDWHDYDRQTAGLTLDSADEQTIPNEENPGIRAGGVRVDRNRLVHCDEGNPGIDPVDAALRDIRLARPLRWTPSIGQETG
jgi:hypothetical protein